MPVDCNKKNPLVRNGTHQLKRVPEALSPDSFNVDNRSIADLILFAQRYSKEVQYYDDVNKPAGDWQQFFSNDISAILAGILNIPIDEFVELSNSLQTYITLPASSDNAPTELDLRNNFKLLLSLPFYAVKELGEYYDRLQDGDELKQYIQEVANRELAVSLELLIGFYKGAYEVSPAVFTNTGLVLDDFNISFDETSKNPQIPRSVTRRISETTGASNQPATLISDLEISESLIADFAPLGWTAFYNNVDADSTPYDGGADLRNRIYLALHYNLLVAPLNRILPTIRKISGEASNYFEKTLEDHYEHTPHYGLWLAFLKLFRNNQRHLNTITERHLDYYYKEILQLTKKQENPDKVPLVFELAKTVDEHLLKQGVSFKAGKDDAGKAVNYQLDNDFVINRASIGELKALSTHRHTVSNQHSLLPFASPIVNSSDGKGEELPKVDPMWKPFGPFSDQAEATIGFSIADKQLFLREGSRVITIEVTLSEALASLPSNAFIASLTTEEGWFDIDDLARLNVELRSPTKLVFTITLNGEDPEILHYNSEIHDSSFDTSLPMLKILFNFDEESSTASGNLSPYTKLKDVYFESIELSVNVSNVRNITLQNELGILDTAKPFLPFGPFPETNSSLVLGSSEMFSKRLEKIHIHVDWEKAYSPCRSYLNNDIDEFTLSVEHLQNSVWNGILVGGSVGLFAEPKASKALDNNQISTTKNKVAKQVNPTFNFLIYGKCPNDFALSSNTITVNDLGGMSTSIEQTVDNRQYDIKSTAGYLRFTLDQGFGHSQYIDEKTVKLIEIAQGADVSTLPVEPYTPTITDIQVNYLTTSSLPSVFYHLTPFGFSNENNESGRLFPEFENEGELYIGVKDLDPPQRLSMYFHTIEGSANPLKNENELEWHVLKGDEWIELEEQFIDDKTDNLSGSGIIGIAVPDDADTKHNILQSGIHWLRLSVQNDADALNDILGIYTQAATATYLNQANSNNYLSKPLPAGTISKLKVSDGAVKKITQPAESTDGKPVESSDNFYRRVSERLRHKDRAVTMWDYEHIVLEEFPEVYKVKCLNHTKLHRDNSNNIISDNEIKPGHVVVVPIPYVSVDSVVNPLRPYTNKKTISQIFDFLKKRISPFVSLEVQNPKIEEIQVSFDVAFNDDIADINFYKNELAQAILQFLTPWTYQESADIEFGGEMHKSTIINFIEEQKYVNYIKDTEMYHKSDIEQLDVSWARSDEDVIKASTSRSILVSHASHMIHEI